MDRVVKLPLIDSENALNFTVSYLKTDRRADSHHDYNRPPNAFDLFVPDAIHKYLSALESQTRPDNWSGGRITYDHKTNASPFYEAAWNLCQRGTLMPGTVSYGPSAQYNARVEYGRGWLKQVSGYEYISLEFGHFAKILAEHSQVLGINYHSRSQEALRCYRAQAYLACCTMCGASAEAILLKVAIQKSGDEESVHKSYMSGGGRARIENSILGQQNSAVEREFRGYMDLLKYWRDNAPHGSHSVIQESEAFISLTLLLRFAQFVSSRLPELTT